MISALVAGCGSQDAAEPVDLEVQAPVVSVDMGQGRSVEFHDLGPDGVLLAESGPIGVETMTDGLVRAGSLSELYRQLTPDQDVPMAIQVLDGRHSGAPEAQEPETRTEVDVLSQALGNDPGLDFRDEFCDCGTILATAKSHCDINVVGNSIPGDLKVDTATYRVHHLAGRGGMTVNLLSGGRIVRNFPIGTEEKWTFWQYGPRDPLGVSLPRTFGFEVIDAEDDLYHTQGCWWNF